MISVGSAVKANGLDAARGGALGDSLSYSFGRCLVAARFKFAGQRLVQRRRGGQGLAGQVVDDLDGNMLVAAGDAQAGPIGRAANALAHAKRPPLTLPHELFGMFHVRIATGTTAKRWSVAALCYVAVLPALRRTCSPS